MRGASRGVLDDAAAIAASRTGLAVCVFAIAGTGDVAAAGGQLDQCNNDQQRDESTHGFRTFHVNGPGGSIRAGHGAGRGGCPPRGMTSSDGIAGERGGRIPSNSFFFDTHPPLS